MAMVPEHREAADGTRRGLHQNSSGGTRGDQDLSDIFGNVIPKKDSNILCIGFQNIGSFPIDTNKLKDDIIRCGVTAWDFDIFGFAETNIDWRLIPEEQRLHFRMKE
jgi:hypothetical protein